MNTNAVQLQIPTQTMMAALTNLQSVPVRASLETQKFARQVLQLEIALKVQSPDLGKIVNIYA
jgi:hypothetical protein